MDSSQHRGPFRRLHARFVGWMLRPSGVPVGRDAAGRLAWHHHGEAAHRQSDLAMRLQVLLKMWESHALVEECSTRRPGEAPQAGARRECASDLRTTMTAAGIPVPPEPVFGLPRSTGHIRIGPPGATDDLTYAGPIVGLPEVHHEQADTGAVTLEALAGYCTTPWADPRHDIMADIRALYDGDEFHELHCAVDVAHALADFEACRRGYASSLEWVAATGVMRLIPGTEVVVEGDMRPGEWRIEQNGKTIRAGRLEPQP